mmetsp:Transcript_10791/g.44226  ORF Transcript_10791/g.44226 Transcript_10791/m.44226 type:complete len:206 (-) Transcript_10791:1388-2005(-)
MQRLGDPGICEVHHCSKSTAAGLSTAAVEDVHVRHCARLWWVFGGSQGGQLGGSSSEVCRGPGKRQGRGREEEVPAEGELGQLPEEEERVSGQGGRDAWRQDNRGLEEGGLQAHQGHGWQRALQALPNRLRRASIDLSREEDVRVRVQSSSAPGVLGREGEQAQVRRACQGEAGPRLHERLGDSYEEAARRRWRDLSSEEVRLCE